jgi:hypothetical protein
MCGWRKYNNAADLQAFFLVVALAVVGSAFVGAMFYLAAVLGGR